MINSNIAFAQQTPASTPQQPSPAMSAVANFAPLVIIFAVFYFLVIRPQRKQEKERQAQLSKLQPGDEIITASGLYGKIHSLAEKTVMVEVAPNTRIKVARSQLGGVVKETTTH